MTNQKSLRSWRRDELLYSNQRKISREFLKNFYFPLRRDPRFRDPAFLHDLISDEAVLTSSKFLRKVRYVVPFGTGMTKSMFTKTGLVDIVGLIWTGMNSNDVLGILV